MNTIHYNNKDAFSGICYTPFVSYDIESDGNISAMEKIVLEGELLYDCLSGASGIFYKQKKLIDNFNKNYSRFEIKENTKTIFSCENAIIKSIEFDESDYAFTVPFSIELECYEKNFFSGQYGVNEIENNFLIEESDDQIVSIQHLIFAKGFNNNNSAIYNATNWVYQHSGLQNMPLASFINMSNGNAPILVEVSEEIDRFNGTCSIKETYSFDQAQIGNGILRYNVDIKNDPKNFNTVTVNGSIEMGRYGNISQAKERYKTLNFYDIAAHIYRKSTGLNDLSAFIVQESVNEDLTKNSLKFNIIYNNDNSPTIKVETVAAIEEGFDLTNNKRIATMSSKISSRIGIKSQRYQDVLNYFLTTFNPLQEFLKNMPGWLYSYPDPKPFFSFGDFKLSQEKVSNNEKQGFIQYDCSWTINGFNRFIPCYIKKLEMNSSRSLPQIDYSLQQSRCTTWTAWIRGRKFETNSMNGQASTFKGFEDKAANWIIGFNGVHDTVGVITEINKNVGDGSVSVQIKKRIEDTSPIPA